MIGYKRPGNGILPYKVDLLIGRKANRDIEKNEFLDFSMFSK